MAKIEVNAADWNKATEAEKAQIVECLKKNRLMLESDTIIEKPGTVEDGTIKPEGWIPKLPDIRKEVCRMGCDALATSAAAALTLTGPALVAALAAIEAARQACRDAC